MADAAEVVKAVMESPPDGTFTPIALVPNLVGAKAASSAGIKDLTYVISASEKHNAANVNR